MRALMTLAGVAVATAALSLAACASGPTYHAEQKPGVSPASFGTYAWLDGARPDDGVSALMGTDFDRIVTTSADSELAARGYRTNARPKLLVNWHLAVHQIVETQKMADYYGYGPGWQKWAALMYPSAASPVSTDRDEEGTIVIDILLADSRELIWRGFGTAEIDESVSIPERQSRVAAGVRKVVAQLPQAQAR